MISAIIPTYRNPQYLDLCLRSATENRVHSDTEIVVIVDGFVEESEAVLEKYNVNVIPLDKNHGMQYALNLGVMNATNPYVFILNDDNVFPSRWDDRIASIAGSESVITIDQVEANPSIFNFILCRDFGNTAREFQYEKWISCEPLIAKNEFTPDGRLFPFVMSKRWYMAVGGFDTYYQSPFWCDVDFWLKLELTRQLMFTRYHGCHLYHFGSIATKNRADAEATIFQRSEGFAAQQFLYKWGYIPDIVANVARNNTKLPTTNNLRGIPMNGACAVLPDGEVSESRTG